MNTIRAKEIFNQSFLFGSMGEMKKALSKGKKEFIVKVKKEDFKNSNKEIIFSGAIQLLICENEGGRMEKGQLGDGIDVGDYITKDTLITTIQTIINEWGDEIPSFTICTDAPLYYYENARDKLMGYDAELTHQYWSVDLIKYSATAI